MVTSWENTTLENITSVITKGTTPTSIGKSFTLTGINFIKIECIDKSGQFDKSMFEHIDVETNNTLKRSQLNDGDILFSIAGALGRIAIVDERVLPANTNQALAIIRLKKASDAPNRRYVYYQLQSEKTKRIIEEINVSGAQANLSLDNISNLIIPIPKDVKEQERIAEALSDVDSMISSLEKLIAKKKAIKQGAMQELLTGKKRLPGFTGEWAHMELGKYGSLMKETINPQLYSSEYFWEYSMPAFDEGRTPIKQKGADMHSNRTVICGKVLLFNKLNVRQKRIWLIDQCRDSAVCSSEFLPYKSDAINLELLSQILYTDKVTLEFIGMSTGTSNSQKRITPDAFLEYKVYLPVNEKEQAAIANVFSCMDNEIEALEQKLEKTRQIKQGMMQQLLTGKIRLVPASTDNNSIEAVSKPHHNHQFDDAVMIAAIVNEFYNDTIPLGRKKVQKLLYLLRRKQEADTSAFKKKAAGPYADEVRYKGGEPIAIRSKYVAKKQGTKGTTFSKGEKIESALEYIKKWEMTEDIKWLASTFKYTKTTDLELFATIDMAMCDLEEEGIEVSVDSIKNFIASNKEWKGKLLKTYFSDKDIARAIMICKKVL